MPLPTTIYQLLSDKQKEEFKRTVGGWVTPTVRTTVDAFNALEEAYAKGYTPTVSPFLSDEQQQTIVEAQLAQEEPEYQEELKKTIQERHGQREEFLKNLYGAVLGDENIEMVQRGDQKVAALKKPEKTSLKVTRGAGAFIANLVGINKFLGPTKFISKPGKFASIVARGESAAQLSINPMEANLAVMLGEMISDDNEGFLGEIETYLLDPLKYEEGDSMLEARMKLLGEGLIFTGAFEVGLRTLGASYRGAKGIAKEMNVPEAFVDSLKNIRQKGLEPARDWLNIVKETMKRSPVSGGRIRNKLVNRREELVKKGEVKDMGDIHALDGWFFGRSLNTRFSSSSLLRQLNSIRGKIFAPRQGVPKQLHKRFIKTSGGKDQAFAQIAHIARNIEGHISDMFGIMGKIPLIGTKAKKDALLDLIDKILYTDYRSPTIVTSKGISVGRRQTSQFKKELNKLPENLREPVRKLRLFQDALSEKLIKNGLLDPKDVAKFRDQLGFYVRKSYKLWEEGTYFPSLRDQYKATQNIKEIILKNKPKAFKDRLAKGDELAETQLEQEVNKKVLDLLSGRKGSINDLFKTLDGYKKVNKLIIERTNPTKNIENFLGIIRNPIDKFTHSTTKMARYVADLKFYDETFEEARGIYIFKNKKNAPAGFDTQIPKGHGALSETYTSQDIAKFIQEVNETSVLIGRGKGAEFLRRAGFLKSIVHAAKTVYSHTTQILNVAGSGIMTMANGINIFSPHFLRASKVMGKKLINTRDKEYQELIEDASYYNLFGKSVVAGDVEQGIKEFTKIQRGRWNPARWLLQKGEQIGLKAVNDKFTEIYRAGDEVWKIGTWFKEIDNLTKFNNALNRDLKNLNKALRDPTLKPSLKNKYNQYKINDVKQEAADIVEDVLQNYDFVAPWIKVIRSIPVVGKFYSFVVESVRLAANTVKRTGREITLGRRMINDGFTDAGTLMLNRGIKRGAAFTATAYAMESGYQKLFGGPISGSEEDLGELEPHIKQLLPSYAKNSNILITKNKDGYPFVSNISHWNPYDYPIKPFRSFITKILSDDPLKYNENETIITYLQYILDDVLDPILGPSLAKEALGAYFDRTAQGYIVDETGNPRLMSNPYDRREVFDNQGSFFENLTNTNNLKILFGQSGKLIEPGSLTKWEKFSSRIDKEETDFGEKIYPALEWVNFLTGFGGTTLNPEYIENKIRIQASKFIEKRSTLKGELNRAISSNYTIEEYEDQVIDINQKYYTLYRDFVKTIKGVEKLNGAFPELKINIFDTLDKSSLSKMDVTLLYDIGNSEKLSPILPSKNDLLKVMGSKNKEQAEKAIESHFHIINTLGLKLAQIPVYAEYNENETRTLDYDKETFKHLAEENKKLRQKKFKGGEISEDYPVPNVAKEPSERIDKNTGLPYEAEMDRLGFAAGGSNRNEVEEEEQENIAAPYLIDKKEDIEELRKLSISALEDNKKSEEIKQGANKAFDWIKKEFVEGSAKRAIQQLPYLFAAAPEDLGRLAFLPYDYASTIMPLPNWGAEQRLSTPFAFTRYTEWASDPEKRKQVLEEKAGRGLFTEKPLLPKIKESLIRVPTALMPTIDKPQHTLGELIYTFAFDPLMAGQLLATKLPLFLAAATTRGTRIKGPKPSTTKELQSTYSAELSELGLYSRAEQHLLNAPNDLKGQGLVDYLYGPKRKPQIKKEEKQFLELENKITADTTKEELLQIIRKDRPDLYKTRYKTDPMTDMGSTVEIQPIDPLDGITDHSLIDSEDIFNELKKAINDGEYSSYYGKDIHELNYKKEYSIPLVEKIPSNIGYQFRLTAPENADIAISSISDSEAARLFNKTVKNKTDDELMELAEDISRLRFSEDPYKLIRYNVKGPEAPFRASMSLPARGIGIYGNDDVGYALVDLNMQRTKKGELSYSTRHEALDKAGEHPNIMDRFEAGIGDVEAKIKLKQYLSQEYGLGADKGAAIYEGVMLEGGRNYEEITVSLRNPSEHMLKGEEIAPHDWETVWGEPVVLHILTKERDVINKKTGVIKGEYKHVDELQADVHEAGRARGYLTKEKIEERKILEKEYNKIGEKLRADGKIKPLDDVPDERYVPHLRIGEDKDLMQNYLLSRLGEVVAQERPSNYATYAEWEKVFAAHLKEYPYSGWGKEIINNNKTKFPLSTYKDALGLKTAEDFEAVLPEAVEIFAKADRLDELSRGGIQDLPFKDIEEWVAKGIHAEIQEAVWGGQKGVVFSNAEIINRRYSGANPEFYDLLYDKIIPRVGKKIANKLGAKTSIETVVVRESKGDYARRSPQVTEEMFTIELTPEALAKIEKEGIGPDFGFSKGGLVDAKEDPLYRLGFKGGGLLMNGMSDPLVRLGFKGGGLINGIQAKEAEEDPLVRLGFTGGGLMVSVGITQIPEKVVSSIKKRLEKRKAKRDGGRIGFQEGTTESITVTAKDPRKQQSEAWARRHKQRSPQGKRKFVAFPSTPITYYDPSRTDREQLEEEQKEEEDTFSLESATKKDLEHIRSILREHKGIGGGGP